MPGSEKSATGLDFLVRSIAGYGITHVFYVESILRRTLLEMEEYGVKRVMTHSEKAAAYMADGYARAAHRPGLCLAQSVGAANLAAGLQEAWLAKTPVVAISGRKPSDQLHRNTYQEINHWPLFEPVTKYNVAIEKVSELPQAFRQLFREAVSGAPGPVHCDMPNHQAAQMEIDPLEAEIIVEERFCRYPPFRPEPAAEDVTAALDLIYAAERPLVLAGGGAMASRAGAEIRRLIEGLNVPLVTSADGKGIVPETHPLCLGVMGGYGRACANRVAAEADLMLCIGSSTDDQTTRLWTLPKPGTMIIQLDINPTELGRNFPNDASLLGDARAGVALLVAGLRGRHANAAWTQQAQTAVKEWRESLQTIRASHDKPIQVERLCRVVQETLPADGVLVVDTGFSAIWAASHIELTQPDQRCIRAAGGSLGWAYPASLGVKCGLPDRPVVCFTGDGGFWYHLAEMETAVRCNIPTVTIVYNNRGFGMCRQQFAAMYKDTDANIAPMYEFAQSTGFAEAAAAMGVTGVRVEEERDIADAIKTGLAANKPYLVEVMTDIRSDPQQYT